MNTNPLDRAISYFGSQKALAAALQCTSPSISGWKKFGIPDGRHADIEDVTHGHVSRYEFRPKLSAQRPKPAKKKVA